MTLQEFKAAVGLAPQDQTIDAALRFHEARLLVESGRLNEAVAAYQSILEVAPDDPWIYRDLVDLYVRVGHPQEAVAVLLALADVYLRLGRTDEVLQTYQQAAALSPDDPEVQARLSSPPQTPFQPGTVDGDGHADSSRQSGYEEGTAFHNPAAPTQSRPSGHAPGPVSPHFPGAHEPSHPPQSQPPQRGRPEPPAGNRAAPPRPQPGGMRSQPAPSKPDEAKPKPFKPARAPMQGAGSKSDTIGQILKELGFVKEEQLRQAMENQNRTGEALGAVLIEMKVITETQLAQAMAHQWGYKYMSLKDVIVDPQIARLIPHSLALRLRVMPLNWEKGRLVVALTDPLNVLALDDVRLITGKEVDPVITTNDDLMGAISRHYHVDFGDSAAPDYSPDSEEGDDVSVEQLKSMVEDAPIVKLVNSIIDEAIRESASDIHIEPQRGAMLVRYRIDGVLHDVLKPPPSMRAPLVSRIKIMADLDIAERRKPQDGRIHLRASTKTIDLRVSTLPTVFGEKVVMRILDQSTPMVGLSHLGFDSGTLKQWEEAVAKPYGMILVTGPTGSGKTTTLYGSLNSLNTLEKNIVTVEDPVEYQMPRVNQVQVHTKAGLGFATGLRSILRQDPDIIMVGEIRDKETAEIAVQAALTGHLVLSTLHTNDAASAINRLIDMGIEPFLISSSVIAILAQRLARQICTKCKISYKPPIEAVRRLGVNSEGEVSLYRGQGCDHCRQTGYKGRVGVFELLWLSDTIKDMVVRRVSSIEIKAQAVREGMRTLRDDGLEKVLSGVSTIDEILRVVYVAEQ